MKTRSKVSSASISRASRPPLAAPGGKAQLAQHAHGNLLVDDVVLHQQDAQAAHLRGLPPGGLLSGRLLPMLLEHLLLAGQVEGRGEAEFGAFTHRAAYAHLTAHEGHQLPRDGQPQAGAPELPGVRRVGLGEAVEEPFQLLVLDADTRVPHGETDFGQATFAPDLFRADGDPTLARELQGVADEIHQHLTQAAGIPQHELGQSGDPLQRQAQALFLRLEAEGLPHLLDQVRQDEDHLLQLQLARLDLGEIQDIVHHAHQGPGRTLGDQGGFFLLLAQIHVHQQLHHADDGVQGRADLVAHVGHEQALGLVGGVGLAGVAVGLGLGFLQLVHGQPDLLGALGHLGFQGSVQLFQFGAGLHETGDIPHESHHQIFRVVHQMDGGSLDRNDPPIGPADMAGEVAVGAFRSDLPVGFLERAHVLVHEELRRVLAQDLLLGLAQQFTARVVDPQDASRAGLHDERGILGAVENSLVKGVRALGLLQVLEQIAVLQIHLGVGLLQGVLQFLQRCNRRAGMIPHDFHPRL